jgi:hypothetical protein
MIAGTAALQQRGGGAAPPEVGGAPRSRDAIHHRPALLHVGKKAGRKVSDCGACGARAAVLNFWVFVVKLSKLLNTPVKLSKSHFKRNWRGGGGEEAGESRRQQENFNLLSAFHRIPTSSATEQRLVMHLKLAGKGNARRACIPKDVRPNWFTSLLLALTENIQFLTNAS